MSAAGHVERDARERNPFAIINTVLAVAAATIWLIALPAARDASGSLVQPNPSHRDAGTATATDEPRSADRPARR